MTQNPGATITSTGPIDRVAVETQLDRIVSSTEFRKSERMCRFLRLVTLESLNGNAATLKEYRIGTEVFDKDQSFDPRLDPIVRNEARRLRRKLEAYYLVEGTSDRLLIELPKGAYVPAFSIRMPPEAPVIAPLAARPRRGLAITKLAGGLAVILFAWWLLAQSRVPSGRAIRSIAVLPFNNLTGDPTYETFTDGLTDELIHSLSTTKGLEVAARSSSYRFKGKTPDLRVVGSELATEAVLEGQVRKIGGALRITADLVSVASGHNIWSETFDREAKDFVTIQDDVSRRVAARFGATPAPPPSRIGANSEASNAYAMGRHFLSTLRAEDIGSSRSQFEKAVQSDPKYAAAFAALATSYQVSSVFGLLPRQAAIAKSREFSARASELAPNDEAAELALATHYAVLERDYIAGEKHFRRALSLAPEDPLAHAYYAITCLLQLGRLDEARYEARKANELDPVSNLRHMHSPSPTGVPATIMPQPSTLIMLWISSRRARSFQR